MSVLQIDSDSRFTQPPRGQFHTLESVVTGPNWKLPFDGDKLFQDVKRVS